MYFSSIITIGLIGVLFVALIYTTNKIETACVKSVSTYKIAFSVFQLNTLTHEYLIYHEERMIEQWRSVYDSLVPVLDGAELNASVHQNYLALDSLFSQITVNYAKKQKLLEEHASQGEIDSAVALEEQLTTQFLVKSQEIFSAVSKLAEDNSAEAMALNALSAKIRMILLLILGLFSIMTMFVIMRAVVRSLSTLHKGVDIFGGGNLEYKIDTESDDEIGQVARAFNAMAAKLKASYDGLEEKVRERTKQLAITEADARRERDQTEIYLQSIGDGVVAINRDWKITLWNKAATIISGYSKEEAIGKNFRDVIKFISEHNRKENISFIEDAIVSGKAHELSGKTVLIRKDGKEIPVGDSASPVFSEGGMVNGAIIIFRDSTIERETAGLRSDFTYASHQLRTPVTKAMWLMESVIKSGDVKKIKTGAKETYQALESIRKLSEELVAVSEIDQDTIVPVIETVKLADLFDVILNEVKKKATAHQVKIITPSISMTASVVTCPRLLQRALVEILDNAIIYSHSKSEINITVTEDNGALLFEIKDPGIGIDLEHQPLVFTKFFRGSNFKTSEIAGAGLGLYIAKRYIELLKGKIWFKTEPKQGTTFYVSIRPNLKV